MHTDPEKEGEGVVHHRAQTGLCEQTQASGEEAVHNDSQVTLDNLELDDFSYLVIIRENCYTVPRQQCDPVTRQECEQVPVEECK